MLFNIPLESLEERYSEQWNIWFPTEFKNNNVEFLTIYPKPLDTKINQGAFLDVIGTNYFKSMQLANICQLFQEGKVNDGDVFFFHDLWFPGIEQLFYIRDATGIKFKITGMLHAGTYDEYDFLAQKGMTRWARKIEQSWFNEIDIIFVATEFHKELLKYTDRCSDNVIVTSFPLHIPLVYSNDKEDIIVFPHRMHSEKQPELFNTIFNETKKLFPSWKFIFTKEYCNSKLEYYQLLTRAKVAVSFALQETWGIAQQEAMMMGCIPVVPDRLSYKEMYNPLFRYSNVSQIPLQVEKFMIHYKEYTNNLSEFESNRLELKKKNNNSISLMLSYIKGE